MKLAPCSPFLAAAALCGSVTAQKVAGTLLGDEADLFYGVVIDAAGDVNGDGHDDFIVGAPAADTNGTSSGRVDVYSGLDLSVLHTLAGPGAFYLLGDAVGGAGDVDNDGFDDFIVGARLSGTGGSAHVYSGNGGNLLHSFTSALPSAQFGSAVTGIGDVNGDNHDDVVVGAFLDSSSGQPTGAVRCFSGLDGSVLWTVLGDDYLAEFGKNVDATGDVDGDGIGDVIVGADMDDLVGPDRGSARVLSGVDGASIWILTETLGNVYHYGYSVAGAGDVNGDGRADLLVGTESDSAYVYSGLDGSVLYRYSGHFNTSLGHVVDGVGDVDGDGFDDFLLSAPTHEQARGYVTIKSGATGLELFAIYGRVPLNAFGLGAAGLGDLDNDGLGDFAVGAPYDDTFAGTAGFVRVFRSLPLIGANYCGPAVPNSSLSPAEIAARGSLLASDNCVVISARRIPVGEVGYFLGSAQQGFSSPASSSGHLCLRGSIARFNGPEQPFTGPGGTLVLDLTHIPTAPIAMVAAGETWNFQCWYRDGATNNFSNAVAVTFQ